MLIALMVSYACFMRAEQNPYARYVETGFSVIDRWALQDAPDQELFEGAMRGMIGVLREHGDEHSRFVDEQQRDAFREDLLQEFGGVGVRIRLLGEPPLPTVVGPPEHGTPAFRADIRSGDRILAIDALPAEAMDMFQVLKQMRGHPGDPIELTIQHLGEDKAHTFRLIRSTITQESILGDLRDDEGNWQFRLRQNPRIGYVRITKFGDKTEAELTQILAKLTTEPKPIEALILDVRHNPGGTLDAAVGITDLFLRAGLPIVSTRGRDGILRDQYVSTGGGLYLQLPIAVLINHNSASASEILAACLQDHGRAMIIGQRSYGKGTVQRLMRIESGRSLLKLTSATYWRPSGKNIHRMAGDDEQAQWGVFPNQGMQVELDQQEYRYWRLYRSRRDTLTLQGDNPLADQFEKEDGKLPEGFTDRALDRAVEHLKTQLSGSNS